MYGGDKMIHTKAIWHDRKRNFLGLPWTFTVYELTADKLYINTGLFNSREDEVRLYRVTDLTLTRSLWQKITGTGTIHCDSADKTMQNFDIVNIKNSVDVKEKLSDLVEEARQKSRVYARESMDSHGPGAGRDLDGDGIPDELEYAPDYEGGVPDENDAEENH